MLIYLNEYSSESESEESASETESSEIESEEPDEDNQPQPAYPQEPGGAHRGNQCVPVQIVNWSERLVTENIPASTENTGPVNVF